MSAADELARIADGLGRVSIALGVSDEKPNEALAKDAALLRDVAELVRANKEYLSALRLFGSSIGPQFENRLRKALAKVHAHGGDK